MTILNSQISILILNLNGLNTPNKDKTYKLNKKSKHISTLYPDPSHKQGHKKTQNKRLEEDSPVKQRGKKKNKTGVVTFISDKIDYNSNQD